MMPLSLLECQLKKKLSVKIKWANNVEFDSPLAIKVHWWT